MKEQVLLLFSSLMMSLATTSNDMQPQHKDVFRENNSLLGTISPVGFLEEYDEMMNESISDDYLNYTDEEYLQKMKEFIFPKTWTWILILCHIAVFFGGLAGNVLVCAAVYRNYSMRTVTNYFIVNLAVADFLVILICLPPTVIWDVTLTWFFGTVICKIVLYLQTVSVTVSVLTLTFISIDRWYAICFPLKFKSTTRRAKTAIIFIWIVALVLDIPEVLVYAAVPHKSIPVQTILFTQCDPSWSKDTDTKWTWMKLVLLYALPLTLMIVSYVQIIRVLWKSGNTVHRLDEEFWQLGDRWRSLQGLAMED